MSPTRRALLIAFATLLVLHPLLIHGPSCGQDLAFHIQSWLDAAHQLRHGHYPHWDTTTAWNAGEPRFIFYPPISWLLGALLTLIFPINLCPTIFIAIALLASGLTFYKLASQFVRPNAALIAATLYLANPYMLFTAFERSALAELLAAAWIPLLLLALLRPRPTIRGVAIPLALLWLTNAPAAVIGTYTLALLATLRVVFCLCSSSCHSDPELAEGEEPASRAKRARSSLALAKTYLTGTTLGLTLPAFYLIPAAYQRRFIQVAMAIIPNMRYQDNFLFTRTSDTAHNAVNHTISTIALTLLLTAAALLTLLLLKHRRTHKPSVILSERSEPKDPETLPQTQTASPFPTTIPRTLPYTLTLLTALIAVLLTPISSPLYHHLPELAFLQFPWRLLVLLTPILALTIALLIDQYSLHHKSQPSPSAQDRLTTALTLLLPLAIAIPAYRLFHQPPDPTDNPTHLAQLFLTHHGFPPTDEYTPTTADNDPLRSNNPAFWLLPLNENQATNPNTPAPNTAPTAAELNPTLNTDDTPIPDPQTLSTPAPHHLTLTTNKPAILILNLRDYPNWDTTETNSNSPSLDHPAHIPRNDGLITIPLPAGQTTINITWHNTPDETAGLILSTLALLALALTFRRRTHH